MDSCAWLGFSPPPVRLPVEARHGSLVQVPLRQANLQAIQQPVEAMRSGRTWKTNSQIRDKRSRGQNTSKETAKVACAVASCAPLEFNITRPQPLKRAVGETIKKKVELLWLFFGCVSGRKPPYIFSSTLQYPTRSIQQKTFHIT